MLNILKNKAIKTTINKLKNMWSNNPSKSDYTGAKVGHASIWAKRRKRREEGKA